MTSREQAERIISEIAKGTSILPIDLPFTAKLVVDEIIRAITDFNMFLDQPLDIGSTVYYWNDVKREIQKL